MFARQIVVERQLPQQGLSNCDSMDCWERRMTIHEMIVGARGGLDSPLACGAKQQVAYIIDDEDSFVN